MVPQILRKTHLRHNRCSNWNPQVSFREFHVKVDPITPFAAASVLCDRPFRWLRFWWGGSAWAALGYALVGFCEVLEILGRILRVLLTYFFSSSCVLARRAEGLFAFCCPFWSSVIHRLPGWLCSHSYCKSDLPQGCHTVAFGAAPGWWRGAYAGIVSVLPYVVGIIILAYKSAFWPKRT